MDTTPESPADAADRLSRRRARVFSVLALLVLLQQLEFFRHGVGERVVDHVRFGAWVLMAAAVLFALTTGGFFLRGRGLRHLMNDEVTRANRGSALGLAFTAAMIVGIALYPFAGVLGLSAHDCLRLVVTTGLIVGLMRFAGLERRALG
jgi:MFS family permease